MESDHDEKPPYTLLHEVSAYNDFWVMLSRDSQRAVLVYSPSWQQYASLGYNRDVVPHNGLFFDGAPDLSQGRVVSLIRDTTLGAGTNVLRIIKGEYVSEITLLFLPLYKDRERYLPVYQSVRNVP